MSNWPLLIAIPVGLVQIHRRKRLVRGLYAIERAGRRAAEGMAQLERVTDAITAAV